MENQAIIKSLKALEASLSEIESARTQVSIVTSSAEELSSIIFKYTDTLGEVSKSISDILQESKKFNLDTLKIWNEKILEIQAEISKIIESISSNLDIFEKKESMIIEEVRSKILDSVSPIDEHIHDLSLVIEELKSSTDLLRKEIDRLGILDLKNKIESISNNISGVDTKIVNAITDMKSRISGLYSLLQTEIAGVKSNLSDISSNITTETSKNSEKIDNVSTLISKYKADIQDLIADQNKLIIRRITIFGSIIIILECLSIAMRFFGV